MLRKKLGEIISRTDRKIAGLPLKRIRFPVTFHTAFWAALICGLFAHGMALFNKYSWHDDIFSLFLTGTSIESGRWMLHVFSELEKWLFGNGHFSLPLFNGMLSLICIGLSAGLICVHIRIRSRSLCALVGGIMAVFPVIASLFGFMFTVHYYMIALLMLTAGCTLICTEKSWWKPLLGILLCGCALGVYQAFIPNLLMMILMDVLMILRHREEKTGYYIRIIMLRVLCIACVMGVYFLGNQYFLWAKNLRLQDYLGISNMARGPLSQYLAGAARAYREFFRPTQFVLWDMYPQAVFRLYRIMLVLDILLGVLLICQEWKKGPVRSLLTALCLAIVPLGCNFIFVMSEEVHSLMMYGQLMQMVLLICLIDWQESCWPSLLGLARRGIALLLALSVFMYTRYDNQCYMKSAFQQQEAISWNTTLIARIESVEGFRDELPVAFINRENMRDSNLYNMNELDFLSLGAYDANIHGYLNDWAWQAFMARWCGFEPQMLDSSLVSVWPEVEQMPSYPDDGSIQVIRDVIVVKF